MEVGLPHEGFTFTSSSPRQQPATRQWRLCPVWRVPPRALRSCAPSWPPVPPLLPSCFFFPLFFFLLRFCSFSSFSFSFFFVFCSNGHGACTCGGLAWPLARRVPHAQSQCPPALPCLSLRALGCPMSLQSITVAVAGHWTPDGQEK